jgi:hypothetical protein
LSTRGNILDAGGRLLGLFFVGRARRLARGRRLLALAWVECTVKRLPFQIVFSICIGSAGAQNVIPVCAPTATAPLTVVTPAQRAAAGKAAMPPITDRQNGFAWPDSEFGVFKSGGGYVFFASDGGLHSRYERSEYGSVTRTVGTLDDPLGTGAPIDVIIHANPNPTVNPNYATYTYMGGGRVYPVPAGMPGAGSLLDVYHAEINTATSFYSLLGLAASSNGGQHWTDLGEIIRLNQAYQKDLAGFDIGSPRLVTSQDGNYFYVYFPDWIADGGTQPNPTNVSVARAPVADVLQAAFGGGARHAARFEKYYKGAWSQPGIGGLSTDLNPGAGYGGALNVAYSSALARYVMILDDTQNVAYAESPDGLAWTLPVLLGQFGNPTQNANYAVPVGLGADPNTLGSQFYVFYTQYPTNGAGWPGASVERFTVSCQ